MTASQPEGAKEFIAHDHPAANSRIPLPGDVDWAFRFTLEDGTELRVRVGESGYRAFESMFLENRDADYQERDDLRAQLHTLRGERDQHEHCIAEIQADALKVAERENELHAEKDAQIARLTQEKATLEDVRLAHEAALDADEKVIVKLEAREQELREACEGLIARLREAGAMHRNGGFVGDNIDRWLNNVELFSVPLAKAALAPRRG